LRRGPEGDTDNAWTRERAVEGSNGVFHFAVALRYEQGDTPAPVCVAKGMDEVALRIKAVAEEHRVPVVEDPSLARALYATVDIDQAIPRQHYEAVAKVIGFVMRQAQRRLSPLVNAR